MSNSRGQRKQQKTQQDGAASPVAKPEKRDSAKEQSVGDEAKKPGKEVRPLPTSADWWSVGVQAAAAVILVCYTAVNFAMFKAMKASNDTSKTIADTNAKLVELAQRAESPAFTVARGVTTVVEGKNLKMVVTLKNSGKGVAKIRQTRWVIASETAYWSRLGTKDAPDSTLLGPGDLHEVYEIFNWSTPESLKADAIIGVRVYIMIDYVDPMGEKRTDVVCQHYDSTGGTHYCLLAGPD